MSWFSRAWNYVKEKASAAKELVKNHIGVAAAFVGGTIGAIAYFTLHAINATIMGNALLFLISSGFGIFAGLTAAAFLPISILLGAAISLIILAVVKNAISRKDKQDIAASEALVRELKDNIEKLKAERTVENEVMRAHETAAVTEDQGLRADVNHLTENLQEMNHVLTDADLANREEIERVDQKVNIHDQQIKEILALFKQVNTGPAAASATAPGPAAGLKPVFDDKKLKEILGLSGAVATAAGAPAATGPAAGLNHDKKIEEILSLLKQAHKAAVASAAAPGPAGAVNLDHQKFEELLDFLKQSLTAIPSGATLTAGNDSIPGPAAPTVTTIYNPAGPVVVANDKTVQNSEGAKKRRANTI